jgi:dienelactone hydrolase
MLAALSLVAALALPVAADAVTFRVLDVPGGPRLLVWSQTGPDAGGAALRFGDYVAAEVRGDGDFARRLAEAGREATPERVRALLDAPARAARGAGAAGKRAPLVLVASGRNAPAYLHAELAEALAAQGFVVAVPTAAPSPEPFAQAAERLVPDLERALERLKSEPDVDDSRVGFVGWSVGGVALAAVAAERPEVKAMVSLDSGLAYDYGPELLARLAPRAFTAQVPLLHVDARGPARYLVPREESYLRSRARLLRVASPLLSHGQVHGFGAALARADANGADVARAHALVVEHVQRFLAAHLLGDRSAAVWLERGPAANGAPPALLTMPERIAAPPPAELGPSPLWGRLVPGPYVPGRRTERFEDRSRLDGPKSGPYSDPAGPRPRPLVVHVWYPAQPPAAGPALTLGETARLDRFGRLDVTPEQAREAAGYVHGTIRRGHRALSAEELAQVLAAPLRARLEAPPFPGRFPLLIGTLRQVSTAVTAEYLASHGYVVAFVETPLLGGEARDMEAAARDMEVVAARLREGAGVDPRRTGALGFSGSGFAQFLLAMTNTHVDALVDLESAVFAKGFFERLSASASYRPEALRIPFLHVYGRELAQSAQFPEDASHFFALRHSERTYLRLEKPGLDHWDVATEGMATATVLSFRSDPDAVQRTFEAANEVTLRFFDAHLKQDAAAAAWLRAEPAPHAGVVSFERHAAEPPPPAASDVERLVVRGDGAELLAALRRARDAGGRNPVLADFALNRLGYRLRDAGQPAAGLDVLRLAAEIHPGSANVHDSLAEMLEAASRRDDALAAARRAFELAATQPGLADATRRQLRELNEARIARLSR